MPTPPGKTVRLRQIADGRPAFDNAFVFNELSCMAMC
jgi:hypothetical protein